MSTLTVAFIEMVRRAGVKLNLYCETCGKTQTHRLHAEDATSEVYKCVGCGSLRRYVVR